MADVAAKVETLRAGDTIYTARTNEPREVLRLEAYDDATICVVFRCAGGLAWSKGVERDSKRREGQTRPYRRGERVRCTRGEGE